MSHIRAVSFDFGKTLADGTSSGTAGAAKYLKGLGRDVSDDGLGKGVAAAEVYLSEMREKHGLRYPKDERVWFHYCRHMVEEALGVDDGSEIAEEMWKTDFHETELLPDGLEAVESSNMQGYLVMIISNWEAPTLHDICERLGISKHVDLILPSRDAESAKPDSVIFEMALSKLKVRPDETVHIGDSFGCDVIGARSAGMTPIHLATEEETPSDFMGISVNNILDALGEVGRMTQR